MELKNKTIAIAGVGGFIGLRMAERALERGMNVQGIDHNQTVLALSQRPGIECWVGDVTRAEDAAKRCTRTEIVVHPAAFAKAVEEREHFCTTNVGGSRPMAQAAEARVMLGYELTWMKA